MRIAECLVVPGLASMNITSSIWCENTNTIAFVLEVGRDIPDALNENVVAAGSPLPHQRVEQQLVGTVGLGAVLRPDSEEDHPPILVFGFDHGRPLREGLFADEPSA